MLFDGFYWCCVGCWKRGVCVLIGWILWKVWGVCIGLVNFVEVGWWWFCGCSGLYLSLGCNCWFCGGVKWYGNGCFCLY